MRLAKFKLVSHIFIISCLLMTFTGCKEMDFDKWIESVNLLLDKTLELSNQAPYNEKHYIVLKNYFNEIDQITLTIKSNPKLIKYFNSKIKESDLESLCSQVFISKVEWLSIVNHCTRNNFFLCSEEVRTYNETLNILRSFLDKDQRNRFDNTNSCRDAIEII